MDSNRGNQRHPLQHPPAIDTSAPGGGAGIGRSAPIRTVGPPPSSLPHTPTLVKSKLVLTPGRQQQQAHQPHPAATTAAAAPSSSVPPAPSAGVAYATRNPRGPLPPQPAVPPPPPVPAYAQTQPSPSVDDASADPVVLARRSPGAAAKTTPGGAHIVSLPPPTQTASHPLDVGSPAPAQGGGGYQPYSREQYHFKHPPPADAPYKGPPPPPAQPTPAAPAPKPPSPAKQQRGSPRRAPSTPDEEVDAFLRGDLADAPDGGGPGVVRKLRPSPLPDSQSILEKAKTLASRRAWGDVIRVTHDALVGKEAGMHHCWYSELLAAAGGHASSGGLAPDTSLVASGSDLERLRRETCELMSLRFMSQLKLRRYADLGAEVASLGLLPHLPDQRWPGNNQSGGGHVRAISGISGILHDGTVIPPSPGTPGTFGTLGTEASIDVLSSSPAAPSANLESRGNQDQDAPRLPPLAWKEGSLHPPASAGDALPSWVPFGLRVLAAGQLQYNEGSSKAIDVLYDLRDRCVRTEYWNTAGMEVWRPVVDNSLVNAFVRKREWRLALRSLEDLMGGLEGGAAREADWWCDSGVRDVVGEEERRLTKELIATAALVELLSRQLLVLLQSGAVRAAETVQDNVRLHAAKVASRANPPPAGMHTLGRVAEEMALVRQAPRRLMVNEGLILFARGKYDDASQYFRDALHQQRMDASSAQSNDAPLGCPTWRDLTAPALGFDAAPSLVVECLNNMSLCLLYSGHMRSAVRELEGLVREDPCRYLAEGVAFNLCTLYELGSDGEECARKKRLLQRVAKRFYLHDVGVESFRLG